LQALGSAPLTPEQAAAFQPQRGKARRNQLSVVLVACWLLGDGSWRSAPDAPVLARAFLTTGVIELAAHVRAPLLVSDPDRREELARVALKALGLRPAGETEAQAQDRLATLNTAERQRVIAATRAAEARAQAVRAAMAAQAAQEAADKWTRE
jgi:hypothetical protein